MDAEVLKKACLVSRRFYFSEAQKSLCTLISYLGTIYLEWSQSWQDDQERIACTIILHSTQGILSLKEKRRVHLFRQIFLRTYPN